MTPNHLLLSAALGLLTLTISPSVAQPATAPAAPAHAEHPRKAPGEKAAAMTQRMTRDLTLTPEQQAKVATLNTQLTTDLSALRATDKAAKGERRTKAQQLKSTYEASLKATLTADQYSLYEKQRAEREQKMRAHHQGRHGAKGMGPKGGRGIEPGQPMMPAKPAQD